jgi:N-methylhydantoinase A/oxoprolinase/acetone carboxylase beta subunit
VFTTFGLLSSEIGMEQSENVGVIIGASDDPDDERIERELALLEAEAARHVQRDSAAPVDMQVERSADVRFRHQVQTLPINLPAGRQRDSDIRRIFCDGYTRQFGLTSDDDVEVVQLRVRVSAKQTAQAARAVQRDAVALCRTGRKQVALDAAGLTPVDHYELRSARANDDVTAEVAGPAVVDLVHTTVVVPEGWRCRSLANGDLALARH